MNCVNLDKLKEISGGDRCFELDLINSFQDCVIKNVDCIATALTHHQKDKLKIAIHTLRGDSANMGADKLHRAICHLEHLISTDPHGDYGAELEKLRGVMLETQANYRSYAWQLLGHSTEN